MSSDLLVSLLNEATDPTVVEGLLGLLDPRTPLVSVYPRCDLDSAVVDRFAQRKQWKLAAAASKAVRNPNELDRLVRTHANVVLRKQLTESSLLPDDTRNWIHHHAQVTVRDAQRRRFGGSPLWELAPDVWELFSRSTDPVVLCDLVQDYVIDQGYLLGALLEREVALPVEVQRLIVDAVGREDLNVIQLDFLLRRDDLDLDVVCDAVEHLGRCTGRVHNVARWAARHQAVTDRLLATGRHTGRAYGLSSPLAPVDALVKAVRKGSHVEAQAAAANPKLPATMVPEIIARTATTDAAKAQTAWLAVIGHPDCTAGHLLAVWDRVTNEAANTVRTAILRRPDVPVELLHRASDLGLAAAGGLLNTALGHLGRDAGADRAMIDAFVHCATRFAVWRTDVGAIADRYPEVLEVLVTQPVRRSNAHMWALNRCATDAFGADLDRWRVLAALLSDWSGSIAELVAVTETLTA